MINEFSFFVFKINFVNKRLSILQKRCNDLSELDKFEQKSLIRYRQYLTDKSVSLLGRKPFCDKSVISLTENVIDNSHDSQKKSNVKVFNEILGLSIYNNFR
jgi:hypothetical protein